MTDLMQPEAPPSNTQQMIDAARKQSEQLRSASPSSAQNFIRRVVQRVVVHPDKIEVEVSKSEIHAALATAPRAASHQGSSDTIRLALEARIKRCGGEMRLVVPPDLPDQGRPDPVSSLLKVVARALQWSEWVMSGKVWGGRSIAEKTGLDERYASQILECAFLAPDIVDAILDGRQPGNLTWKKLTRHVPMNWVLSNASISGFHHLPWMSNDDMPEMFLGCAFLSFPATKVIRDPNSLIPPCLTPVPFGRVWSVFSSRLCCLERIGSDFGIRISQIPCIFPC